jgi:hypothetical protein
MDNNHDPWGKVKHNLVRILLRCPRQGGREGVLRGEWARAPSISLLFAMGRLQSAPHDLEKALAAILEWKL